MLATCERASAASMSDWACRTETLPATEKPNVFSSAGNACAGAVASPSRSRTVLSYSARVSRRSGAGPIVSTQGGGRSLSLGFGWLPAQPERTPAIQSAFVALPILLLRTPSPAVAKHTACHRGFYVESRHSPSPLVGSVTVSDTCLRGGGISDGLSRKSGRKGATQRGKHATFA